MNEVYLGENGHQEVNRKSSIKMIYVSQIRGHLSIIGQKSKFKMLCDGGESGNRKIKYRRK